MKAGVTLISHGQPFLQMDFSVTLYDKLLFLNKVKNTFVLPNSIKYGLVNILKQTSKINYFLTKLEIIIDCIFNS